MLSAGDNAFLTRPAGVENCSRSPLSVFFLSLSLRVNTASLLRLPGDKGFLNVSW